MRLLEKVEALRRFGDLQNVDWQNAKAKHLPNGRVLVSLPITLHPFKTTREIAQEFKDMLNREQKAELKEEGFMTVSKPVLHLESHVDNEDLQDVFDQLLDKGMNKKQFNGNWVKQMSGGEYRYRHGGPVSEN